MIRSIALSVLVIGMWSVTGGCAKSSSADAEAPRKIGDLLPGPPPGVSMMYVEDQAGVKLAAERDMNLEASLESFRKSATGGAQAETSAADESADGEDKDAESASKGEKEAEDGVSEDSAEAAPAHDFGVEIVAAKTRNERIPPNPEKKGEEFEKAAHEKAKAAAFKNLLDKVHSMKTDPVTTIGGYLKDEEVTLELKDAFVVGAKWLDVNRIEVEMQLRMSNLVDELTKKTTGGIVPVLKQIEPHKCISATGIGQGGSDVPVDRARPGERARRASEGIGS